MGPRTLVSDWFDEKFRLHDLSILETTHWLVSLRPAQPTLGSLVLSLRRPCDSLGEIAEREAEDLSPAFARVTRLLADTFEPDKVNYLALMMVDPHVHFHVIPRYEEERTFGGIEFRDAGWPGPPSLSAPELTDDVLFQVRDELRAVEGAD